MQSRRDFLAASIAVALSARRAAAADPVLGLIFPPKDYPVPPEATRLYPTGVKFLSRGIGLERLTPDGYDAAIPKVIPAAESLVREGATAEAAVATLAQAGVLVVPFGPRRLRAVTHLDIARHDVERAADAIARTLA